VHRTRVVGLLTCLQVLMQPESILSPLSSNTLVMCSPLCFEAALKSVEDLPNLTRYKVLGLELAGGENNAMVSFI